MNTVTRNGLHAIGAGLAVGLIADLVLPVEPWGLNMFLCTATLLSAGAWMIRRAQITPSSDTAWLAISVLLLAAAFLRRDAEGLQALDFIAMVGLFGLTAAAASGVALRRAEVGRYMVAVAQSAVSTLSGGFQLIFGDVAWRELPLGKVTRFRGVALGVVLALPLLLVFGALFAAADPAFSAALGNVFALDLGNAVAHTARTVVLGGLAAGWLRGIAFPRPSVQPTNAEPRLEPRSSGAATPIVTALVLLNALFLAFVAVQLRYFFGGSGRIESVAGLTYAEYARQGFFELVAAAGAVLPVLLGGDWAVRGADATGTRRFRIAAAVTLGLMGVVMVSALQRMQLYVAAFGLTEDRLYATAGMAYIALLLGWLGWTVLRGRAHQFAFGGVLQGLAVLAGLHTLNPDAFIARHNLARQTAEQSADIEYIARLGADAAPVLFAALPNLSGENQCIAAKRLAWYASRPSDWRTWNWSRSRAAILGRETGVVETVARCTPPQPPAQGTNP